MELYNCKLIHWRQHQTR